MYKLQRIGCGTATARLSFQPRATWCTILPSTALVSSPRLCIMSFQNNSSDRIQWIKCCVNWNLKLMNVHRNFCNYLYVLWIYIIFSQAFYVVFHDLLILIDILSKNVNVWFFLFFKYLFFFMNTKIFFCKYYIHLKNYSMRKFM